MAKTTGERLKEVIEERELTKYKLAQDLNWSKSTLSNYVEGKTIPKGKRLHAICKALKISPVWLISGSGPKDMLIEDENDYDKSLSDNMEAFKMLIAPWLKELHKVKTKLTSVEQSRDELRKELIAKNKELTDLQKANAKLVKEILRLQKK